jgi:hypothetical protein
MSKLLTPLGSNALLEEIREAWPVVQDWRLPGFESATIEEKWNLLTRLTFDQGSWKHAANADELAAYILAKSPAETQFLERFQMMAEPFAGPKVVAWLEQQTSLGAAGVNILWQAKGVRAIPQLARFRNQLRGSLIGYYKSQLNEIREQAGISETAWNLLMLTPSTKSTKVAIAALQEIMSRGITLPVAEWRLLADHDVCGELIRGLVFATPDGKCFVHPDWPLHTAIVIATASLLPPDEVARWKGRPGAPFDQWQQPTTVNPVGLRAEPANLFLSLESQGWIRSRADRHGMIRSHRREFPELNITVEVEYSDGVPTRFGGRWQQQTILNIRFTPTDHPVARGTALAELAAILKAE